MMESKHGGARPYAGRPHEHQEYILVEIIDFYGDEDTLLAGPVLNANGTSSATVMARAEHMAAHHVNEGARRVRILRRKCCVVTPPEILKVVKE